VNRRVSLALRWLFGAAGLAFMITALVATIDRARGSVVPSWSALLLAAGLAVIGLIAAARGWEAMLGARHPAIAASFFTAQLGKYIPGGIWQPVGQVGLVTAAGVPVAQAATAFPIHALVQVAAAGTVGVLYAFTGSSPGRWLALLGIVPVTLLHRGWMVALLRVARHRVPRLPDEPPSQRAIVLSYGWSLTTFVAAGAAFSVLLGSVGEDPLVASMAAFGLAWSAGFLLLPVPAGLGVREAVMVGLLGATAPILAASIAHRLVTMAAEAILIVASRARAQGRGATTR